MKKFLALMLLPVAALAGTATTTPGVWQLYRGSTLLSPSYATEAGCVAGAAALNVTRTYTCRTQTAVAVTATVTPPPPPVDTDGDGLVDSVDACPTVYALTANGCPIVNPGPTVTYPLDGTENPLNENGAVVQTGLTGTYWTAPRKANGWAFSGQDGCGCRYDDSIALFQSSATNYRLTATVHLSGTRNSSTSTHEIELIARGNYTAGNQRLYEANIGYSGSNGFYAQIVRMDGGFGSFTEIGNLVNYVPTVKEGDKFVMEVVGSSIKTYLNGLLLQQATDTSYATGKPGIGFFWRGTERADDFGISDLTVEELP